MEKLKVLLYTTGILAVLLGFAFVVTRPVQQVLPSVGALAGPNISSPYLAWGGVFTYQTSTDLVATSSVPCSFLNPAAATTTLVRFSADITANGLGTQKVTLSTSTTAFASSSPFLIYDATVTTGASKSIAWQTGNASTSPSVIGNDDWLATGESPFIIGPNQYLNLRVSTSSAGTFSTYLSGSCKAVFQVI